VNIKPPLHTPVTTDRVEADNPLQDAAPAEGAPRSSTPEEATSVAPVASSNTADAQTVLAGILEAELAGLAPEHRAAVLEQLEKDPLLLELTRRALNNGGNT
jgi:hypothetical protein